MNASRYSSVPKAISLNVIPAGCRLTGLIRRIVPHLDRDSPRSVGLPAQQREICTRVARFPGLGPCACRPLHPGMSTHVSEIASAADGIDNLRESRDCRRWAIRRKPERSGGALADDRLD